MPLYMAGLDYGSVPVDVWAACRLSPDRIRACLTSLFFGFGLPQRSSRPYAAVGTEMVILSTCSRLEIYVATEAAIADVLLHSWLLQAHCLAHSDMARYLTHRRDREAIEHLLRVAIGCEPPFGEPNILETLMEALVVAQECGTEGPILTRAFGRAIHVGKRAHAEAASGDRSAVLGHVAVCLLHQRHPESVNGNLLIVGASKWAHLAAKALLYLNSQPAAFVNRTAEQTETMKRYGPGQTFSWHQMRSALAWADVVIMAAAALQPILDADDIATATRHRRGQRLLLIDLGLPHNVHPAAATENIIYYDLDALCAALTDLARPGVTRVVPSGPLMTSLLEMERIVKREAAILCAWIDYISARRAWSTG